MAGDVGLLLFVGKNGTTPLERLVFGSHLAIALDLVQKAWACDAFAPIVVATNRPDLAAQLPSGTFVEPTENGPQFHFGRTLHRLIARYQIERPLYIGGGSSPLISMAELASLAETVRSLDHAVVANNFFSADFFGFHPGTALAKIALPAQRDNSLPLQLVQQAGLQQHPLEPTLANAFDVDTPTDLAILSLHPLCGPATSTYLARSGSATYLSSACARLRAAMVHFVQPESEIVVAGRVSVHLVPLLRRDLACRLRIFSEARGMSSSVRPVHSLLGYHLDAVGPDRFFQAFSQMGNALFLDSRVLFAHQKLEVSAGERFASDAGCVDLITHPQVRAFTQAALESVIPVVLGGHSAVSGGLWALVDAAWRAHDKGELFMPQ